MYLADINQHLAAGLGASEVPTLGEHPTLITQDFGVRLAVVGNKVADDEDVAFLRDQAGDHLLCC